MKTLYKKFNNILIFLQIKKKVKRKYTKKIKINKEMIIEQPIILIKEKTQQEVVLQFLRLYNKLLKRKTKVYQLNFKKTYFEKNKDFIFRTDYKREKLYFNIKDFLKNRDLSKCSVPSTNEEFVQDIKIRYKEIQERLEKQYNKEDFKDMQLYKKGIVFYNISYMIKENSLDRLKNIIEKIALHLNVGSELFYNNLIKDSMLKVQCSKRENLKLFFNDNNFSLNVEDNFLIYKKDKCEIKIKLCQKK